MKKNIALKILSRYPKGSMIPKKDCEAILVELDNHFKDVGDQNSRKNLLPFLQGRKPATPFNVTALLYNMLQSREGNKVLK